MPYKKKKLENKKKEGLIMIRNYVGVKLIKAEPCKAWKDFLGFLWLCAKCGFKGDK